MTDVKFYVPGTLPPATRELLRQAKQEVLDDEPVNFKRVESTGSDVLSFTGLWDRRGLTEHPYALNYLKYALKRVTGNLTYKAPGPGRVLYFDIETHNAGRQYGMDPQEFFRLGQYAWDDEPEVHLTDDYHEMLYQIERADIVVGHNIHAFDLSVLYGTNSTMPLLMSKERRVFDTFVHSSLALPAPDKYTDRNARTWFVKKPGEIQKWLGLDNLNYQLGLDGKEGSLKELAKKYNPPKTKVADYDYSLIPLDDPDFRAYAVQDVHAARGLSVALCHILEPGDYEWREQLNAAIDAQNSRNGFTVDIAKAQARVDELTAKKDDIMTMLVTQYGFPTEGTMPWRTNAGKAAIMKALEDVGVTPQTRPDWKQTKTGNISLGGEVLLELTAGTDAEELGVGLATVMGQRSLAQLALDSVTEDGKAHPEITSLQRSGRKSTTKPGLTVWSARGDKAIEKSYWIPSQGRKLVEFDYSQADARIVAAYSGDTEFAKRFEEGVDAHELTGRMVFGDEAYDADPYTKRQEAKACGHAYAYRAGPQTISNTAKVSIAVAETFVRGMERAYPDVYNWQEEVTAEGRQGWVVNDWGRVMLVQVDRAYTQGPAMYGQSGTRELMVDALIRMLYADVRLITWLVAQVHDALVFDIPDEHLEWAVPLIKQCMETHFQPKVGGQSVHFPAASGHPADNWMEAGH